MDPVPTTQAAGQISADGQFRWDGQQWVPLASNYREPTPWTRPMQLITAALFAISAISGVVTTIAFVNHDSVLRAIHAQGTQVPAGTNIDTVVNVTIGITYGVAIFFRFCIWSQRSAATWGGDGCSGPRLFCTD